jgi:UDP-N-acetylmuramoyl-L-alanyl-D-glutamate--2,6-diaminopimelate ligase
VRAPLRAAEFVIAFTALRAEALPGLLGTSEIQGNLQGAWEHVRYDSREVLPRDVFVAVSGLKQDGHAYVEPAARRGALAAVVERFVPEAGLPQIRVHDARRALAILAHEETGHPSRELTLAGVTGTNGKTTTAHLIRAVFEEAGMKAGFIGTVGYEFDGRLDAAPHTTPEAPDLLRMLRDWRARGATAVAMEVSSHALALDRTYGLAFDVGVFTNLTQDHLDFHGTLESYRDAKARLFRTETRGDRTKRFSGAVNVDDPAGRWIQTRADCPVVGFGTGAKAQVRAEDIRLRPDGTTFRIREDLEVVEVSLCLRGAFNAMNALAAFTATRTLGIPRATIVAGLEKLASVPGRLEPVDQGQPFQVLVDYAHTPDALERALEAVRAFRPARVLCVFGCGGDRDKGKRPIMGSVAARLADQVILTSDNPRSEDPSAILREIEAGVRGASNVRTIVDRATAIEAGIGACAPGDALLIAGKGHETYQIIGTKTLPFDDREVARGALRSRGFQG